MKPYSSAFSLLLMLTSVVHAQHSTPTSTNGDRQSAPAAQQVEEISEGEVLRIKASLVSVPISVIDRQGKYIVDLRQQDFRIYEDGVEQSIAHFSNIDQPLSVVMLLDTSGSTASFLDQIKAAAKSFVKQFRSFDSIQPVYFHGDIKALTAIPTNDRDILSGAVEHVTSGPTNLGTRLYDAVDFAISALKPANSRKAIILFTDGENTWGKATMKGTLKEAEESDIIIYTLQYRETTPVKYLQQLAEQTGGRFYLVTDSSSIAQSFAAVAEELRRQYVIGYYPKETTQKGRERKLKIRVNREHIIIRARRSYTSS